jgi:hypothetical protein
MPATDNFTNYIPGLDSPGQHAVAVTPNDGADIGSVASRALWIGVSGDVSIDVVGGETAVVFKNVPIGWLQMRVTRVRATNTTATNIVAVY